MYLKSIFQNVKFIFQNLFSRNHIPENTSFTDLKLNVKDIFEISKTNTVQVGIRKIQESIVLFFFDELKTHLGLGVHTKKKATHLGLFNSFFLHSHGLILHIYKVWEM